MPRLSLNFNIKGFRQDDLIANGQSSTFAFENKNLRLNTLNDCTTFSWTNERSTKKVDIYINDDDLTYRLKPGILYVLSNDENLPEKPNPNRDLSITTSSGIEYYTKTDFLFSQYHFKPIGLASLDDYWVLFCVADLVSPDGKYNTLDAIFRFNYVFDLNNEEYLVCKVLYTGHLNFSKNDPIETLCFYENSNINKVYWVDGINQPRVVNILDTKIRFNLDSLFDFIRQVSLHETMTVSKITSGGVFTYGTVLYAISYFKKYGQETNLITVSDMYCPNNGLFGLKEDGTESSSDSFEITITNPDLSFDYVRLYALERSSDYVINKVRIVEDKSIDENTSVITIIDNGEKGSIVTDSSYSLLYIGGALIIAKTLDLKDNTLFLGNIKRKIPLLLKEIKDIFLNPKTISYTHRKLLSKTDDARRNYSLYPYVSLYNIDPHRNSRSTNGSNTFKVFRSNEYYRLGLQFLDNTGSWSDVCWVLDFQYTQKPIFDELYDQNYIISKCPSITLTELELNIIRDAGYKRIRALVVFPTDNDRTRIFLGIINPTVASVAYRSKRLGPHNISSWFFRPIINNYENSDIKTLLIGNNTSSTSKKVNHLRFGQNQTLLNAFWRHGNNLTTSMVGEIQSIRFSTNADFARHVNENYDEKSYNGLPTKLSSLQNDEWLIDWTRITFNSPDIEYNDLWWTKDFNNDDFVLLSVGNTYITGYETLEDMSHEAGFISYHGAPTYSLINNGVLENNANYLNGRLTSSINIMPKLWRESDVYTLNVIDDGNVDEYISSFPIYPWHCDLLGNYLKDVDNIEMLNSGVKSVRRTSKLNWKVLANRRISTFLRYYDSPMTISFEDSKIWHGDSFNTMLLKRFSEESTYVGNLDNYAPFLEREVKTSHRLDRGDNEIFTFDKNTGYMGTALNLDSNSREKDNGDWQDWSYNTLYQRTNKIPIKFKSTPHLVFSISRYSDIQYPIDNDINSLLDSLNLKYINASRLILADVVRRYLDEDKRKETMFGGLSEDALLTNVWRIANNQPYDLYDLNENPIQGDLDIVWKEGDHYFMRYDCLKTYPSSVEDLNQVIEIASTFIETRIPLDGRYDNYRKGCTLTDATNVTFGKVNTHYNQNQSYFTGAYMINDEGQSGEYPNQLMYSLTKKSTEKVDVWTSIAKSSPSTYDADGDIGLITKILNRAGELILFLDHGISIVGWNERSPISNTPDVPLAIVNTLKLTGIQYITKEIGCQNKWSISLSKDRLMWIDDYRHEINAYDKEGLKQLSTEMGIDNMFIKTLTNYYKSWTPNQFYNPLDNLNKSNYVTYYDKVGKDIFFITKDECFAFNDVSGTFTSFYDYNKVSYLNVLKDHTLVFRDDNLYALREGDDYSFYFDKYYPYWLIVCCDGLVGELLLFNEDKVFDTIEYRADMYTAFNTPGTTENPFDTIQAFSSNQFTKEYNTYNRIRTTDLSLITDKDYPWCTTRKFNVWRDVIPKFEDNDQSHKHRGLIGNIRDRIRNTFSFIKLKKSNPTGLRMVLHNSNVIFSIK